MRDELQAEDEKRREGGPGSRNETRFGAVPENEAPEEDEAEDDNDNDNENDDEPLGVKVAG